MTQLKSFQEVFEEFSKANEGFWILEKKFIDTIPFKDKIVKQNVAIFKCIKPGYEWCRYWIREVDEKFVLRNSNCGYGNGEILKTLTFWN